jgi:hypothetical protein
LLGLVLAAVNVAKWPAGAVCATYSTAHHGATAFGCQSGAKSFATVTPPIGCALLVLAALAFIWIPGHSDRRRSILLGIWALLLIAAAGIEVLVYSALPV